MFTLCLTTEVILALEQVVNTHRYLNHTHLMGLQAFLIYH